MNICSHFYWNVFVCVIIRFINLNIEIIKKQEILKEIPGTAMTIKLNVHNNLFFIHVVFLSISADSQFSCVKED